MWLLQLALLGVVHVLPSVQIPEEEVTPLKEFIGHCDEMEVTIDAGIIRSALSNANNANDCSQGLKYLLDLIPGSLKLTSDIENSFHYFEMVCDHRTTLVEDGTFCESTWRYGCYVSLITIDLTNVDFVMKCSEEMLNRLQNATSGSSNYQQNGRSTSQDNIDPNDMQLWEVHSCTDYCLSTVTVLTAILVHGIVVLVIGAIVGFWINRISSAKNRTRQVPPPVAPDSEVESPSQPSSGKVEKLLTDASPTTGITAFLNQPVTVDVTSTNQNETSTRKDEEPHPDAYLTAATTASVNRPLPTETNTANTENANEGFVRSTRSDMNAAKDA
ncbi:unnamed protein product [Toxocara canis]|uniref:Conserved secreted protein n=1 Tax=Toxocara canis TaxID=6265 RepID=A0A183UPR1_TOXCA|nr:unnamed protein product [Toxocara canis]